jgi:ABC-type polysaccharide/polyol phosphate export permease
MDRPDPPALTAIHPLIRSLVSRDLKARYRGSVLGFFWSFINPLLLLITYGLVFTYVLPARHSPAMEPYLLFFACGILPWTWFQSSLAEASGVLIAGGNLIKKVLFPAEVLPVVTVFANLAQMLLALPILALFLLYEGRLSVGALWVVLAHPGAARLHAGVRAPAVGADRPLPRHPEHPGPPAARLVLRLAHPVLLRATSPAACARSCASNPMTHILVSYQQTLFEGSFHHGPGLLGAARGRAAGLRLRRLAVRPAARHAGGGSVTAPARGRGARRGQDLPALHAQEPVSARSRARSSPGACSRTSRRARPSPRSAASRSRCRPAAPSA